MTDIYKRGGRRPGAGRPKNSGKWSEPTVPVRIPARFIPLLEGLRLGFYRVVQVQVPADILTQYRSRFCQKCNSEWLTADGHLIKCLNCGEQIQGEGVEL